MQQEGEHFDGLAEAHVVREDAAQAQTGQAFQPSEPPQLVGAQLAMKGLGLGDGLVGKDLQIFESRAEITRDFHLDGLANAGDAGRASEGRGQGLALGHAFETGPPTRQWRMSNCRPSGYRLCQKPFPLT